MWAMDTIVGITEFRDQAKRLVDQLGDDNIVVVRHSRPVAILMHPDRLERLLTRVEDLEDEIAVLSATGDTVPFDVAKKELLES